MITSHTATVARLIHQATLVAHYAARMDGSAAAGILIYVDEPKLLCELGEKPPEFLPAAVGAARLIGFDASAQFRDGKPRHFNPGAARP